MSKSEVDDTVYTLHVDNGQPHGITKDDNEKADALTTSATNDLLPSSGSDASVTGSPAPLNEFEDNTNVPKMNLVQIFTFFFLEFGLMAWGGPVAQIARIKDRLVIKRRWITITRFNRVFAVYQMLPGPEAAELCMFFGCLVGGRLGGMAAGFGFILPGFLAMILLSYLYTIAGLENIYVNASFRALQPVVAAMVLKAVFKIGEHAFVDNKTKKVNSVLFLLAILSALQSALRINYFITLGVFGIFYSLWARGWKWAAGVVMLLNYVGYALYVVSNGTCTRNRSPEAVILGGWLAKQTFLDGIALGNIIPAPLVIFATFVGFQGGNTFGGLGYAFSGSVLMTLGMFFPCFLFTIAGHALLERICQNESLASFFDGITGSDRACIIAITAMDILKASVIHLPKPGEVLDSAGLITLAARNTISAVIFILSFSVMNSVKHQYLSILLIAVAAISGQFLFIDN
ncbi:hypothetical protein BGZ70_001504 [Mortierella alpina]|uniref:Chromate transporter n=1 Tax=Mortierella alpina TaxID=64518 RepID=A0A9P6JE16_MORAP|nr:hypothetical protein BGZ70_001504 [Mortierella alpina]